MQPTYESSLSNYWKNLVPLADRMIFICYAAHEAWLDACMPASKKMYMNKSPRTKKKFTSWNCPTPLFDNLKV